VTKVQKRECWAGGRESAVFEEAIADADAVEGIPSTTLKVIGAGLGRTGTLSLHAALERLGFAPCDHMTNNFAHPERFALWLEAARRKRVGESIDWRPLYSGYRATLDWPGVYFWRELVAAHPEAKVILTVRDPERWYDSARRTIFAAFEARRATPGARLLYAFLGWLDPRAGNGFCTVQETVWDGTFGGRFAEREEALRIFAAHNREVEQSVAPERLLVFDVKQGWEPLCRFLDVPVPAGEPFPHVNDGADFERRQRKQYLFIARALLPAFATVAAGAVTVLVVNRRFGKRSGRG
jgi:hypothetical protein